MTHGPEMYAAVFLACQATNPRAEHNFAGHFYSRGRIRKNTADDDRGKVKKMLKRRQKKGYR
jgi:hypothetical protein